MKIIKLLLIATVLLSFSCKEKKNTATTKELEVQQTKGEAIKLDAANFKSAVKSKNVQLIDVRRPEEFADGHLMQAKNINFYDADFIVQITQNIDKSKPVYLYCRSGNRSGRAAAKLSAQGFKIYDLKGGILDWKANNFEIVKE